MSDDYDGGFDSGFDSGSDMSFDSGTTDTSFDVDSVMDVGADDFAQFEIPVEIYETDIACDYNDAIIAEPVEQFEIPDDAGTEIVDNKSDASIDDFEQFNSGSVLKRNEFDLLKTGYNNVNDILDVKVDDYHDKGFSMEEIADFIAKDKWELQQEFLNDTFPEQDVTPHVFNGFEEGGAKTRIDEINNSDSLKKMIDSEKISEINEATDGATSESAFDVNAIMDAGESDFEQFETVEESVNVNEISEIETPPDEVFESSVESETDLVEVLEVDEPPSLDAPVDKVIAVEEFAESPTEIESDSIEVLEIDESPNADTSTDETAVVEELSEILTEAEADNAEVLEIDETPNADVFADEKIEIPSDVDTPTNQILETAEVAEVEHIQDWLNDINPNYNPDIHDAYHENCGSCALATLKKFEGDDTAVATSETLSIDDMNKETGMEQVEMTPDDMHDYIVEQGAGQMYVVGIDRQPPLEGHWFNAYYDGNKVVAIDGQTNKVYDWPPNFNAINWDISVRKEKNT